LDKLDKEVIYWSIWKLIQYIYAIALILAVCVGILTLLYFLDGMNDETISQTGLITVWTIIVSVIILRNILKPYFRKKTNNYMD
jgi:membrane protein YdbS with pleckstrin-like domain